MMSGLFCPDIFFYKNLKISQWHEIILKNSDD